jgi:hypothetical protein
MVLIIMWCCVGQQLLELASRFYETKHGQAYVHPVSNSVSYIFSSGDTLYFLSNKDSDSRLSVGAK